MKKNVLFLFFGLFIVHHETFTMDEKPLKNKKIQQFEYECSTIEPELLKIIIGVNVNTEKSFPDDKRRKYIAIPGLLSRPINIPINNNDPTELLIYTEKLKILLHNAKENNK